MCSPRRRKQHFQKQTGSFDYGLSRAIFVLLWSILSIHIQLLIAINKMKVLVVFQTVAACRIWLACHDHYLFDGFKLGELVILITRTIVIITTCITATEKIDTSRIRDQVKINQHDATKFVTNTYSTVAPIYKKYRTEFHSVKNNWAFTFILPVSTEYNILPTNKY